MTLVRNRGFALLAALVVATACDSPIAPRQESAAFRAASGTAELCDVLINPICNAYVVTTYAYDPSVAPLPPGVSDWILKITQNGGSLEFLGAVTHGGAPILDVANMFVRFYVDNGDGALGAGDLQVVLRSSFGSVDIHCGIVSTLPLGSVLAPTSNPPLCENSGTGSDASGRFFFDGFRTADLTEPFWVSQGFQPLTVAEPRNIWLFEVGNVDLAGVLPILLAPTAPAESTPYVLEPAAGPPVVPGDSGDTDPDPPTDLTAPQIAFSGNRFLYRIDQTVDIRCTATDAGSGIASATCPEAYGPAYTFGLGRTSLNATATDVAGNSATARTAFYVLITPSGVCELAKRFAKNRGVGNSLCAQLYAAVKQARDRDRDDWHRRDRDHRDHRGRDNDRRGNGRDNDRNDRDDDRWRSHDRGGDAFARHVMAQRGKGLSVEHANLLIRLAGEL